MCVERNVHIKTFAAHFLFQQAAVQHVQPKRLAVRAGAVQQYLALDGITVIVGVGRAVQRRAVRQAVHKIIVQQRQVGQRGCILQAVCRVNEYFGFFNVVWIVDQQVRVLQCHNHLAETVVVRYAHPLKCRLPILSG